MGIGQSGRTTSGLPRSSHLAAAQTRSNTIMTTPGSDEKGNALFTIRGDIEPKRDLCFRIAAMQPMSCHV
jgi:hypothetical protein